MSETRRKFHDELEALEVDIQVHGQSWPSTPSGERSRRS